MVSLHDLVPALAFVEADTDSAGRAT
jgi:hypothetical protein